MKLYLTENFIEREITEQELKQIVDDLSCSDTSYEVCEVVDVDEHGIHIEISCYGIYY